jgi:hypothetical protein
MKSLLDVDEQVEKKTNLESRRVSEVNFKDDNILGYMKMYRKHCKVSENTIGIDDMWRLKVYIDGPYVSDDPINYVF